VDATVETELLRFFSGCRLNKERDRDHPVPQARGFDMAVREKIVPVPNLPAETGSAMNAPAFDYSPLQFFRVMLAVAWSAIAHPFTTTVIDLNTGRACEENGEEGT
jgi:hypothetical protein